MTALAKVEKLEVVKQTTHQHKTYFPTQREMEEMINITKVLATCPYYQKLGPGGVLTIWLTAREMDLPPMMCLNGGLYTFSGQVTMSSKLMNMMITRAGHRVDILESNLNKCRLRFWRSDRPKGNDTLEWEYTIEDAKNANLLNKTNWKTNTRDMLFNRCMSGGAGKFMADVTMGAYLIGEMPGDDEVIDTIPEEVQTIDSEEKQDVKQLYIEKNQTITSSQAIELSQLLQGCSPKVQKNFKEYLKSKFNIDMIDDLPENEFLEHKEMLVARYKVYQEELVKKEMDDVKPEVEVFNEK